MDIASGTTIDELCKSCKTKTVGIVDEYGVANFSCSCGKKWNYSVNVRRPTSKGFTSAWLNQYLQR